MGIRAVVENGIIRPLDPLPDDWSEGHPVVVDDAGPAGGPHDDLAAWYDELRSLGPARYEPGDREQMQAVLDEADRQAKEIVRREMGLP